MMPAASVLFSEMALKVGTLGEGVKSCIAADRFPSLGADVLGNQYMDFNAVAKKFVMIVWHMVCELGGKVAFISMTTSSGMNRPVIGDTSRHHGSPQSES